MTLERRIVGYHASPHEQSVWYVVIGEHGAVAMHFLVLNHPDLPALSARRYIDDGLSWHSPTPRDGEQWSESAEGECDLLPSAHCWNRVSFVDGEPYGGPLPAEVRLRPHPLEA